MGWDDRFDGPFEFDQDKKSEGCTGEDEPDVADFGQGEGVEKRDERDDEGEDAGQVDTFEFLNEI